MRIDATDLRPLGRTTLRITALGFGGAPLGNLFSELAEGEATSTVAAARRAGLNFFDTAPLYGHGLSEHRIGAALRHVPRESFVLATKIGRLLRPEPRADGGLYRNILPFATEYDYSYDGVLRSVEDSLQRLGLARIDVLHIHDVDIWTHGSEAAMAERFAEVMHGGYRALVRLREEKTVGAIGVGVNEWQACQRFAEQGDFDCFLLAGRYTLLEQEALKSFLPLCEKRQISVIIGGPFNTGILATGAVPGATYNYRPAPEPILDRVRRIEDVCRRH
ncbi:MAG: aldo/keto reductase, partial [Alphaproteobacteria bacterium]|nr:aldo/keto reductase [Alphaproteobacteria bacterium]